MNIRVVMVIFLIFITATNRSSSQMSPSPSPEPNGGSGGITSSIDVVTNERCSISLTRSCHDLKNMIACLNSSSSATSDDVFLLVQNNGEDDLQVNVTILDINITFPIIRVPKHQAKRIKIAANIEGSPSIVLNAGNGKCIISIGLMKNYGEFYKQFATHASPIYVAYFLFFTVLIAGGAWACCKIGKNERQVGVVRYQGLEMAQVQAASQLANDEEMAVGWNQGWDDAWEEAQEVKSPTGNKKENISVNGHTSRTSNTDGRGNDWDD